MTFILVRHGETALNLARVLQPAETPLSARGAAQAQAVARRLAGARIGAILSSDLPRALATAQAIGSACGLPVTSSELLRERNFGSLRGQAYDALDHDPIASRDAPPGGESAAEFEQRVALAFELLRRERARLGDAPLVVVSHGLVIRALLERHVGGGAALPAHLGNTAVSIVQAEPPHAVTLAACTAHLDALRADAADGLVGG